MLVNKKPKVQTQANKPSADKMLTMQQAMDYLSDKGVPCKSRATFYRILHDFGVQYVNMNPYGKNEIRRFKVTDLNKVLEAKGLAP
jgi:hypothetical protein